jgi:adenine phosphoribosyltransferase
MLGLALDVGDWVHPTALSNALKSRYLAATGRSATRGSDDGPKAAYPRRPRLPQAGDPVLRYFDAAHPPAWHATVERLAEAVRPHRPDLLIGIESRGFLVAAPLAYTLGSGFAMVRKKGKLPGKTVSYTYDLEYGSDTIEVQEDAIAPGQRVVILDDLLATGGTMRAAIELVRRQGGTPAAGACIIELAFLNGRRRVDVPLTSVVVYDS